MPPVAIVYIVTTAFAALAHGLAAPAPTPPTQPTEPWWRIAHYECAWEEPSLIKQKQGADNCPADAETLVPWQAREMLNFTTAGTPGSVARYSFLPDPAGPVHGIVIIFQGLNDYADVYGALAKDFASRGFLAFTADYRGFGRSSGVRGYIESMDAIVGEASATVHWARASARAWCARNVLACADPAAPLRTFFFGHSLGGLTALTVSLKLDSAPDGLILWAPALGLDPSLSWYKLLAVRILGFFVPTFALSSPLSTQIMRRDKEATQMYRIDPLVYKGSVRAATVVSLLDMINFANSYYDEVSMPLLLFHGGLDTISSPLATMALHEQAKSFDKTLYILPHEYHDILSDINKHSYVSLAMDWMQERCK